MKSDEIDETIEIANDSKYILQSVEKAIKVLNLFFDYAELGTADVAKELNITRGTAFRFLYTLEHMGYVMRTDKAKYRLSMKTFSLGQLAYSRFDMVRVSHLILEKLMEETGESSFLAILDGKNGVIYLDRVASEKTCLRVEITPGTWVQAHCTGVGKAILANQSDSFVEEYLKTADFKQITEFSITSSALLEKELNTIKKSGFANDNQESEIGLSCYAAPVLDNTGFAVAAVSICGPLSRMNYKAEQKIEAVKAAADYISKQLN